MMRRQGKWKVIQDWGYRKTSPRYVTDDELLFILADRYSIVNLVEYVGPEVEETNRLTDRLLKRDRSEINRTQPSG